MRVILEAISGPHSKKRFVLPGYVKAIFGRTEWSDYQFPDDPLISSKHFALDCIGNSEHEGFDSAVRALAWTNE